MDLCPPLHRGVVAIEKEASTKVANFTLILIIRSSCIGSDLEIQ